MDLTLLTAMAAGFISVLVLDFKGDFADVSRRLGRDLWDHYSTADGFRLACGPPYGCAQFLTSWINQYTKVIAAHCDFRFAEATIAATIRIAFKLLNGDAFAEPLIVPSLGLIAELLDTLPRELIASKDEYLRTAQQKIRYLLRVAESLFDAEGGFDIIKHLILPRRCAVVDCTTSSPLLGQIIVNLLALQLMFPRLTKREVSPHTNFALIIDEADQFCSREASLCYPEGYNELGRLVKQGREFGIMVALGTSFLEQCSRFIASNMTYHIIMNQSDPNSVEEAARTLLQPDSRQLIASLECGKAIYKEAMGPACHGMLMTADHVPPSTMARPERFDQHSYTPARGIKDIPAFREKIDALVREHRGTALRRTLAGRARPDLGRKERALLGHMCLHECEPLHLLFRRMGEISASIQQKIIDALVRAKLIEVEQIRVGKSPLRVGYPTKDGWEYAKAQPRFKPLRGGLVHTHVCRWKQALDIKRGCDESRCEFPYPNGNGYSDVGTRIGQQLHFTEIVVGCSQNILQHARDCFINTGLNVQSLTIVTLLKSESNKIRQDLLSDADLAVFVDRVEFVTVADILQELYS